MGTPGRLCALLEMGSLQPSALRLLVLDEADQLLTESFNDDIRWVQSHVTRVQTHTLPSSFRVNQN